MNVQDWRCYALALRDKERLWQCTKGRLLSSSMLSGAAICPTRLVSALSICIYIYSLGRCPIVVAALTVQCGSMRPRNGGNNESLNLPAQFSFDDSWSCANEVTRSLSNSNRRMRSWLLKCLMPSSGVFMRSKRCPQCRSDQRRLPFLRDCHSRPPLARETDDVQCPRFDAM